MKRTANLLTTLALSLILVLGAAPLAKAAMGDTLLGIGSRGPDVVELQSNLIYVGFSVGKADGIFGPKTQQGVLAFQTAYGLKADGLVGPLTSKAVNSAYAARQRQDKAITIVNTANQYLGVRYQWGGSTPETGFDCSGFVSYVFSQNGIYLPRISRDQFMVGTPVAFGTLQPGDLVFFSLAQNGVVDHDGVYIGNGQFINSSSSKGVTIYPMGPYWQSVFLGGRRVF